MLGCTLDSGFRVSGVFHVVSKLFVKYFAAFLPGVSWLVSKKVRRVLGSFKGYK